MKRLLLIGFLAACSSDNTNGNNIAFHRAFLKWEEDAALREVIEQIRRCPPRKGWRSVRARSCAMVERRRQLWGLLPSGTAT